MLHFFRRRNAEKAGDAAMDTVIAAAKKAVQEAAYAAAVAECEARNAAPGTAEMVMRTVLGNANVSEAELIERREGGTRHPARCSSALFGRLLLGRLRGSWRARHEHSGHCQHAN